MHAVKCGTVGATSQKMTLFFDARELGEPSSEYVAWIDVMGIQGALRRSIKIAANFVYKLHDAALQARTGRLRLYPIMDGFYASSPDSETMGAFLRQVFRSSAQEFVSQEKELFRFLIKGALAMERSIMAQNFGPMPRPLSMITKLTETKFSWVRQWFKPTLARRKLRHLVYMLMGLRKNS
jgi:hypothetical protein